MFFACKSRLVQEEEKDESTPLGVMTGACVPREAARDLVQQCVHNLPANLQLVMIRPDLLGNVM